MLISLVLVFVGVMMGVLVSVFIRSSIVMISILILLHTHAESSGASSVRGRGGKTKFVFLLTMIGSIMPSLVPMVIVRVLTSIVVWVLMSMLIRRGIIVISILVLLQAHAECGGASRVRGRSRQAKLVLLLTVMGHIMDESLEVLRDCDVVLGLLQVLSHSEVAVLLC